MQDGRWVCKGGSRPPSGKPCAFVTTDYAAAVTHATEYGAQPPDMPRHLWATA
jgi:hypothetical protein